MSEQFKFTKMRHEIEKAAFAIRDFSNHIEFDYDLHKKSWHLWVRRRLKGIDYVARFPISIEEINEEAYDNPEFQKRFEKFCFAVFDADISDVKDGFIKLDCVQEVM